ncbi:Methyl-branched lipid omega-hydroxylase [Frankia canadensis]|uniref:Methyl-branched lipid omega-hydroxylase n=1 Tax=Frankia canadensis TaxID=1836972 RepID=A0A2I2KTJ9_9ACTN|nr:cytochrome P450 [Frankia canadensis]SNQ48980.1 Methyl-branched lipid omega-hydroxylase [Frankia canadensis]SOU56270.1 Methyl-branched lipid omega-hydroxylase [Frankia canadensis]
MKLVDADLPTARATEAQSPWVWPSSRRFRDASPKEKLDFLAQLRDSPGLVHFDEPRIPGLPQGNGYWALTRHADVVEVSRRPGDFRSGDGALWINDLGQDFSDFFGSIINMDDPRHGRLRRIVTTAFTRHGVRRLHAHIERTAADTIRALAGRREIDIVTDISTPFSLTVICDLLGVPESHHAEVLAASNVLVSGGDPDLVPDQSDPIRAFLHAGTTLAALAADLAEHRRRRPCDDLLTALVRTKVDGTHLTPREIASFFTLLVFAGQETTRNAIALGLWALHNDPQACAAWAADFDRLAPTAVEEIIRHTSPVALMRRTTVRDTTLNGHRLAAGDKVVLYYAAANHDPAVFDEPYQLDLTRSPNPHIGLGGPGPHYCLGAVFARAEITAIFRKIFSQLPGLTITGEPVYLRSTSVNAIKTLAAHV